MSKSVVDDVVKELNEAIEIHSLFTSAHHGYAIILEELDELWDEVKKKKSIRDMKNMRAEAVQVAAMAMKFIISMESDWRPVVNILSEEEILASQAKCHQCLYIVRTDEVFSKLEADPCNTCRDLCNWKPKEEVIEPTWMVCENCHNKKGGTEIPERCESCEDDEYGRPSNFVWRVMRK